MLRGRFYGHLGPRSAFKCTWDTKNPVFFFAIVVFWLIQFSSLSSLSVISISRWIDIVLVIHYQLSCTQAMNNNMQHIRADRRLKHTHRERYSSENVHSILLYLFKLHLVQVMCAQNIGKANVVHPQNTYFPMLASISPISNWLNIAR